MLKQVPFGTSCSTISEVRTAIFLPERAAYLGMTINHPARPRWCRHWAPNPLLFYCLCCSCQRDPDLSIASLLLCCLQLFITSTCSLGPSVWFGFGLFFSAQFLSFSWCFFIRDVRYPTKNFLSTAWVSIFIKSKLCSFQWSWNSSSLSCFPRNQDTCNARGVNCW